MPEPNPRAFATATGFVFQIAGLILAFGGCCVWSLSGKLQAPVTPEATASNAAGAEDAGWFGVGLVDAAILVDIVVTFAGGLGLIAAGLGLQAERPGSGRTALWVTSVMALTWWASLGIFLWHGAYLPQALIAAILAVVGTIFFLLSGASHRTLELHPPPPDQNVVTDAYLEQLQREKRDKNRT